MLNKEKGKKGLQKKESDIPLGHVFGRESRQLLVRWDKVDLDLVLRGDEL